MPEALDKSVLNELMTIVKMQFNSDGSLANLMIPTEKQVVETLAVIRATNTHQDLDEIRRQLLVEANRLVPIWGARHAKRPKAVYVPPPAKVKIGSMASVVRELLLARELTEDQIHETVVKDYPTLRRSTVDYYRDELVKKGLYKT